MDSFLLGDHQVATHEAAPPAAALYLSDEEEDFVQRFGAIEVEFLKRPPRSVFFTRPYALLYFHSNKLYRMRREHASSFVELFLDLLYVGIVANLATTATEHASAALLLQYCLLFMGAFAVWADLREYTNHYFNDDLSQRLYMLVVICWLIVYANNAGTVLESHADTAMVVVPYMACRMQLVAIMFFYSFWIPEHRAQMRLYVVGQCIVTPIWTAVIFIPTRAKVGVSIALFVVQEVVMVGAHTRLVRERITKSAYALAVNIEHEVERHSAFYVIAIGEFLFKVVSNSPAGDGIHNTLWRTLMVAIIAYILMTLYFNGDGSVSGTHPLRRAAWSGTIWLYGHIPLTAGMILAADAAADLIKRGGPARKHEPADVLDAAQETIRQGLRAAETSTAAESPEPLLYALSFFFTGGIAVALIMLFVLAAMTKTNPIDRKTGKPTHRVTKWWRIAPRIPTAIIVLCLLFAEMTTTRIIGLTTLCLGVLFVYEVMVMPLCDWEEGLGHPDANGIVVEP